MNWDSIEVKWSEMARRALGGNGVAKPVMPGDAALTPTLADDGSVIISTVTAAQAAIDAPDRSVA